MQVESAIEIAFIKDLAEFNFPSLIQNIYNKRYLLSDEAE
jgi:hypothetical protein